MGGGGGVGFGGVGQDGCERRIEVFVKIQKKKLFFFFFWGGGSAWGGVRVDVNERIEVFVKIQKNIFLGGSGSGGVGLGGGGRVGGVRMDVNEELKFL